ncbi:MAG: hypothetical protein AAGI72_02445 [Pseudomonadota bacterium]
MAEAVKKTAPKRKPAARKTTAKRKPAARKAAAKKAPTLQSRVTDASRNAFLASLGFYGMAFDQVQGQLKSVESELSARRKKADKLYADMVKRGEKVEKQAKSAIDDIDLPKLEVPKLDRATLEAQLEKAKARFEELKDSVGFKAAA